jgi:iron complex outermembrane receptor protein
MKIIPAIMLSAVLATALFAAESAPEKPPVKVTETVAEKPDDPKVLKLDNYVVTDRQDSAYKSATAITGTKTDTALINIPQNIQVLTKELIEDMGAMDITDLYPLMGAVTEFTYGGVSARGFRQEQTRYNGIAGSPYNEFGVPTLDNVQQVELLKGPVGLLYGDNEPGGLINIVTAKPRAEFEGNVGTRFGSYGLIGGNASVTGPIDAKKRFLYLASANYYERDSFRANYHGESANAVADLTWVISPSTRATAGVEYIKNDQHGARLRGIPYLATGWATDISFNGAEATDFQLLETVVYNFQFDHIFSQRFRVNAYARYFQSDADQQYHETNTFNATTGNWPREFRSQLREMEEYSWAVNAVSDLDFLGAKHKVLFGVENSFANRVFTTKTIPQAQVVSINVYNPVYGLSSGSMYNTSLAGIVPNNTEKIRLGFYLQDQINIREKFHLLVGMRHENYKDERFTPTVDAFDDSVFTYRAGVVYMIRPDIAAFVSFAQGLVPQSLGSEDQNGPFPPQESASWEGGFKFDFFNRRLGITTTAYHIVKTNILEKDTTPGVPSNWLAPIGEVTSDGFEFDVTGQITNNWSLTATYAYNDAMVSKSVVASTPVGSRFPNAPRHKAGFFTRYNLPKYKLGFGFGGSYVGERPNFSGATNFPGPEYLIFNASVFYRWKDLRFTLRCENIFDKVYVKSVFTSDGDFPGNPRMYTGTINYKF